MLVAADLAIVRYPASVQQTIRVITLRPITATGVGSKYLVKYYNTLHTGGLSPI